MVFLSFYTRLGVFSAPAFLFFFSSEAFFNLFSFQKA
jgi:hypothetical protein